MKVFRAGFAITVATGALALGSAVPAGAATIIGETFEPTGNCGPATRLQINSAGPQYAAPTAGVITSWSFQRSASGGSSPVKLKVARAAGANNFTIVGEGELENLAVGLNTYPARIAVQAGDVLGLYTAPASVFFCSRSAAGSGAGLGPLGTDVAVNSTAPFSPLPNLQLGVSATLEPDCDADGLGDETQDSDKASCPPGPVTTFTKVPKNRIKSKRKRARVRFEFTASEPGGFECSLDGATFVTCASPLTAKVKKGKHTFEVRAIDAGGNAGAPAVDTWKVKRKRA